MASLRKQAIGSIRWTTLQTVVSAITGPIFLIVKANFLSPIEFGYMAIVLIVISLFRLIESFGISQAIIQHYPISIQESSTLFYFNVIVSFILAFLLYLSSPIIALFFSLPVLNNYIPMVSIILLIIGPSTLFRAFLEKELYFKQLTLINITKNIIIFVVTTLFLILNMGVLGIIYAHIIGFVFSSLCIIVLTMRYKTATVSLYFNPIKLIPFLRFGFFVFAKQLLTLAAHRLDEVVIGYFLSADILGLYYFGKNMLEKIRSLMTQSFGKVLFPLFSKIKHNPEMLSLAYHRITRYIAFCAFPLFSGIASTAHLFVPVIFGEKWIDSIIVFQIFSVTIILLVLTANISSSLLYSVNKPALVFNIEILTNSTYFISLLFFAENGIYPILATYCCYVIYKCLILQYFSNRIFAVDFLSYFKELVKPAGSTMVMVAVILFFQLISRTLFSSSVQLAGSIIIGVLVYMAVVLAFDRKTLIELKLGITKGEVII